MELGNLLIGFLYCVDDLRLIKDDLHAISLNDVCIDFCAHIYQIPPYIVSEKYLNH